MDATATKLDRLHIAVVEDDREIAVLISSILTTEGHSVTRASRAAQIERLLGEQHVDLLLLDRMLPDGDGLELCRRLRASPRTARLPVIIISALGSEMQRVGGLDGGADDYLVKPFAPEELLARIRAVLRRARGPGEAARHDVIFITEGLRFEPRRRALHGPDGARIMLTTTEIALLGLFLQHPQAVLTRDHIAASLHGRQLPALDRTIDVAVSRLRRKIERDGQRYIETVRNSGYVFAAPVQTIEAG